MRRSGFGEENPDVPGAEALKIDSERLWTVVTKCSMQQLKFITTTLV